jgi:RimJ/RimL family protein N-acetyltransferase
MHVFLRTDRLLLRRFEPSDVDNLLALYTDRRVMRYLDNQDWDRTRIETEVLPTLLAEYRRYRRYGYFAAETVDGSFVGRIALHPVIMSAESDGLWRHASTDDSATVSIGYRLGSRHWGNGFATEAAGAVVRVAFERYGVDRAVATTMAVNHASRRVLERIGFHHTRTLRLHWDDPLPGAEHSEVVYERYRFPAQ